MGKFSPTASVLSRFQKNCSLFSSDRRIGTAPSYSETAGILSSLNSARASENSAVSNYFSIISLSMPPVSDLDLRMLQFLRSGRKKGRTGGRKKGEKGGK